MAEENNEKYVSLSDYPQSSIEMITVSSVLFNGVKFQAVWETDGLKIPLIGNNGRGNRPFYLRIPRNEVIKMFSDILTSVPLSQLIELSNALAQQSNQDNSDQISNN